MSTFSASLLNPYQRLIRGAIVHAKSSLLIPFLNRVYGKSNDSIQLAELRALPPGSVGREVADTLVGHQLNLIPGYESHDLKHVLLGYRMTPEDELLLRAFMLGNGDNSFACLAFLAFGLFTPELWPVLRTHYHRGKSTPPISSWTLAEYAPCNLKMLRHRIGLAAA